MWGMPGWAMNGDKVEVTDMAVTDVHVSINNAFRFFNRRSIRVRDNKSGDRSSKSIHF